MFAFLRNFFHGNAGRAEKITQNGELGAPPTNKETNRSKFSFLDMIWHGFFGRFFAPRMPERIEEGKQHMKNGHQESRSITAKVDEKQPGFLGRKWRQWFTKGQNKPKTECEMAKTQSDLPIEIVIEPTTKKPSKETLNGSMSNEEIIKYPVQNKATCATDLPAENCQNDECNDTDSESDSSDEDNSIEEFQTMKVSKRVEVYEAKYNQGINNSSHSESQIERDKLLPKVYQEKFDKKKAEDKQKPCSDKNGSNSESKECINPQESSTFQRSSSQMKTYTSIAPIAEERNFTKEVILGVIKHGPAGIPIATVDYVNNFKQISISISNHNQELRLTRQGYFTKGCTQKGTIPTILSHGHAEIIFEKDLTNLKMAIRGVLAFNIYPADKSATYDGQAMLVIWWRLPTLMKNRFAVGILNGCDNVDDILYKKMKHKREYWFVKGKAKEDVTKTFPKILGKYNVTVAAQMNNANRAKYLVEIL